MDKLNVQLAGLLVAAASFRLSVADDLGILVTDLAAVVRLRQGATTTGELSTWLGFAPGSTTPVVDRLSAAGLIDRTRDQVDKRRIVIRLTDAGIAVSDRADAHLAGVARDLTRSQDPDVLTAAVDSIVTSLTAATPGAVDPRPSAARPTAGDAGPPSAPNEPLSDLLVTSEVAKLFHVSRETIHYWCRTGRLPSYRTAGGHRRFDSQVIRTILADMAPGEEHAAAGLPPKLPGGSASGDVGVQAAETTVEEADLYAAEPEPAHPAEPDLPVVDSTSDRDDLDDMERALDIRTVIGRAEGILMERYDLTVEQALAALERDSETNEQRVRDSADQLIARNRPIADSGDEATSSTSRAGSDGPATS